MNAYHDNAQVELLREAGMTEADIAHSRLVAGIAVGLGSRSRVAVNLSLVALGGLFHDLGKVRTDGILHGVEGARLGRHLGLPGEVLDIMEKHVRAGVPLDQTADYGLPPRDFSLTTLEEKLVIYADKLSDMVEEPGLVASVGEARLRFARILEERADLAKDEATRARYLTCAAEVEALLR
ncbi:HD domain-containing protein [Nitratidesulfovibrio sp. SRB-5]|uniref:HD domain-containing protein n=1 Tax=Nitratidesulfovibrio sp. SRB-5 TaxID=2872636 RepID=UPI001024B722|nr:HD domain-containing protein [Nitratidesulfovibrio sp. SRB-5]MBZ2170980.1 HDIG domain-containing protein [Nitratidesulfovibrio sp. SRB-5]RXF74546.1 HDIG domain-containing protein [Desulfovibrio sp. DS-1]